MNRKERLFKALRLEVPDRVPMFDFLFQQPMYKDLIGHSPEFYNGEDAVKCALALEHDGVWLPFGGFTGFQPKMLDVSKKIYLDEWGTTYQKNDASWPIDAPIEYPIKNRDELKKYKSPDPTLPGRTTEIDIAVKMERDNLAILGGVNGPLTTTWMLMGFETIALSLYDDPGLVTEVLKISNEFFMEAARLSVEAGCEAMWVSEDLGDSRREFFKKKHYEKYILPPFAEIVEYISNLGVPVMMHCCGQINNYLDCLCQTKINSLHPIQRTAGMDLKYIKEKYGDRLCIIGNIDSSRTLPYGSPEEVDKEVKEAIEIAAPGGGYILASDHSLHDGIPTENILALRDAGLKYGSYQKI